MGFWNGLAKAFSKFKPEPLPKYQDISCVDIPPASILLFYGGTELTETVGNYVYKHPFKPASFHAAGWLGDHKLLNIGAKATIEDIRTEYKSTRRIDVIILKDLTDAERKIICKKFERDAGQNFYDAIGFLRFGGKLKVLAWMKGIHKSDRNDFCSDNIVDNFSENPWRRKGDTDEMITELTLPRKIEVSYNSSEDTAPWHLLEHALDKNFQNGTREVRTLWTGPDFGKK